MRWVLTCGACAWFAKSVVVSSMPVARLGAWGAALKVSYPAAIASVPVQPRVVQYPHGRYALQGDGITTAYQWVWIPNPPSAPPAPLPAPSQSWGRDASLAIRRRARLVHAR